MGCPMDGEVGAVLAKNKADVELVLAKNLGCPIGEPVIAEAIKRDHMHMMVWAFKSGGSIRNEAVVEAAGGCSPHTIKWLVGRGFDMRGSLSGMALRGNTDGVMELNRNYIFDHRAWLMAFLVAGLSSNFETADWIKRVPLSSYIPGHPAA